MGVETTRVLDKENACSLITLAGIIAWMQLPSCLAGFSALLGYVSFFQLLHFLNLSQLFAKFNIYLGENQSFSPVCHFLYILICIFNDFHQYSSFHMTWKRFWRGSLSAFS